MTTASSKEDASGGSSWNTTGNNNNVNESSSSAPRIHMQLASSKKRKRNVHKDASSSSSSLRLAPSSSSSSSSSEDEEETTTTTNTTSPQQQTNTNNKQQQQQQNKGWRVKLYRLNTDGSWDDRGTGRIVCQYTNSSSSGNTNTTIQDELGDPTLVLKSEHATETILLRSKVLLREPYQRQGDNIITWCEPYYPEADVRNQKEQHPGVRLCQECVLVLCHCCCNRGYSLASLTHTHTLISLLL